ncbi:MAG: DUF2332 family protein [Candidatus Nanopelagicales bacterium]
MAVSQVIHGDELICLADALSSQAESCQELGSPLSYQVLTAINELAHGGPLTTLLLSSQRVRGGDLIGLRLLAAAHRLVLTRVAPDLARFYPTAGGRTPVGERDQADLTAALVRAFRDNQDAVRDSLQRIPQTNETGRALPLRGALSRVASAHGQPIRLHELAASAGLNLRVDAFPWAQVPMTPPAKIVERAGCDLHPLDVTKSADRMILASYVWGDDLPRFERLRSSLAISGRIPADLKAMSVGQYLTTLLHTDAGPGQTLVIWHSATWFYLDRQSRSEMRAGIRKLGNAASFRSPVVHVSWEWRRDAPDFGHSYALVARSWPAAGAWAPWRAGTPVQFATGPAHGMPVRWNEPRPLPGDSLES